MLIGSARNLFPSQKRRKLKRRQNNTPKVSKKKQKNNNKKLNEPIIEHVPEWRKNGMCLPTCTTRNSKSTMVGCDGDCAKWFHIQCVGLTQKQAKTIEEWICPLCNQ